MCIRDSIERGLDPDTYIYTSNYINGISDEIKQNATIVVDENGRITQIEEGFKDPGDNLVHDLRDFTVMPGLMDMHVHFGGEYQSKAERPVKVERETEAILATAHAQKTLLAGFTTVRQVGDSGLVSISLRDAINQGHVIGPRIFSAGKSIATTGGHADPTNGKALDDYEYPTAEDGLNHGMKPNNFSLSGLASA